MAYFGLLLLGQRKRLKNFILFPRHINQSFLDKFPLIFAIQHDNILFKVYVIKVSYGLERSDDISTGKLTLIHFQHGVEREAGRKKSYINEIL